MKFPSGNYRISRILSIFLCTGIFTVFLYLCTRYIPGAVSYTVSTANSGSAAIKEDAPESKSCIYDSIYLIQESGPFLITSEGEEIFVFSGDKRLYKIKAQLGQFPSSDRNAILSGIGAEDKLALYETVQYMES